MAKNRKANRDSQVMRDAKAARAAARQADIDRGWAPRSVKMDPNRRNDRRAARGRSFRGEFA